MHRSVAQSIAPIWLCGNIQLKSQESGIMHILAARLLLVAVVIVVAEVVSISATSSCKPSAQYSPEEALEAVKSLVNARTNLSGG